MDLTKETESLIYYCVIIIGPIGFITNLMNIKASRCKEIQKTTMGFFNIRLSIFNILGIVFVGFILAFPLSIGQQVITLTSDSACKAFPFLIRVISQISSWILVISSFDRMFMLMSYRSQNNVKDPQEIKDTKKLSNILNFLFVISYLLIIPNLLLRIETQTTFELASNKTFKVCTSSPIIVLMRDIVDKTSYGILPLILQIVISVVLINCLNKLDEIIFTVSINRERKYTFSVIVFNIIFILTDLFGIVSTVFINIYGYNETSYNSKEAAISSFAYVCSIFLSMFCVSDLLFITNLITNKRYRKEAKRGFLY